MGNGFSYKCCKCGKEYQGFLGVGMLFPTVYQELIDSIKNGEYGSEWKDLIESEENVAVDAVKHVYCCSKCNAWKVEYGLSLYHPLTDSALEDVRRGFVIVGADSGMPLLESVKFSDNYKLIRHYRHKCDNCGSITHKASNKEINNLHCPYCGGERDKEYMNVIMWD